MDEHEKITITIDDGSQLECIVIGVFDADTRAYIALLPEDDDDNVLLYRYDEDTGELSDIESDEEYELVCEVFNELFEDEDDLDEDDPDDEAFDQEA